MLKVSASPHIRHKDSTSGIMKDVCIALIPSMLAGTYLFGTRILAVIAISVAACVLFEYLARLIMKRDNSIQDWSAVVTGVLLACNLPPDIPMWIPIVGAFFAIVVIKQIFGGLGKNFLNPALGARVILSISFPAQMSSYVMKTQWGGQNFLSSADLVSHATPLAALRLNPGAADIVVQAANGSTAKYNYGNMFLGLKPGMLGEVCILALLLGAIYLLVKGVIDFYIPLSYIATCLVFVTLFGQDPLFHLLSGGLFLGAFFMATDYVTCPISTLGQVIFGVGCGLLNGLMRVYGAAPEGTSYSILLMNILTPHIDRLTVYAPRQRKLQRSIEQ